MASVIASGSRAARRRAARAGIGSSAKAKPSTNLQEEDDDEPQGQVTRCSTKSGWGFLTPFFGASARRVGASAIDGLASQVNERAPCIAGRILW